MAADRMSCTNAAHNQLRPLLYVGVYCPMWCVKAMIPKHSVWSIAQSDILRPRLIKLAARVFEMKSMIKIHVTSSSPAQDVLSIVLARIPTLSHECGGDECPQPEPGHVNSNLRQPNSGLRVCPETSGLITEFSEHEAD
jgi:hypothetical protein